MSNKDIINNTNVEDFYLQELTFTAKQSHQKSKDFNLFVDYSSESECGPDVCSPDWPPDFPCQPEYCTPDCSDCNPSDYCNPDYIDNGDKNYIKKKLYL